MRWKCTCSYDGSEYAGWQTQSGQVSVQQVIEAALESIFKQRVVIHGSGRTDAGVHALEQVFHFDFDWGHGGERLVRALYTKLPKTVRVASVAVVDPDFHARFSATRKRYHYRLFLGQADPFLWPYCWSVPERLDLNRVADATRRLAGKRDFAAFAANRGVDYESTVRRVFLAEVYQEGDCVLLAFEADGFMYKMARSLVGTVVNIGLKRLDPGAIDQLLETAVRTPMVQAAPARGLFLQKVYY